MDAWQISFLSLFVVLAASLAGMTWLVRRHGGARGRAGLREWTLGLALQALAWPLFAVPPTVAGGLVRALASGALVAGLAAMLRALLRSLHPRAARTRWPLGVVYVPALGLVVALSWPGLRPETAIALFWAATLATLLAGLRGPLRGLGRGRPWQERAMILIFLVAAVICALRLAEQLLQPQAGPAYDTSITPAQRLALAYFLAAPILATFAFLLSQLERQQRWLEGLAAEDALTGINNRRAFFEQAQRRLARPGDGLAALLMIDVDGFKAVNDEHGHAAGDALLQALAGQLQASAGPGDLVGRFGGDEFCMLLVGLGPGDARARAEQLRARVARTASGAGAATLSIGIAHARADTPTEIGDLLALADRRLYLAKRTGRDRVIDSDAAVPAPAPT